MCWVVPVLLFGVSRCLFAGSQRAKSSELQPCGGFSAHHSLSRAEWLCRIVKAWAQALTIVKNLAALSRGWRKQVSLLRHYCSAARWDWSSTSVPHLLAEQFPTVNCSSWGLQPLPVPSPPLHRHHSSSTLLYFYSWGLQRGCSNINKSYWRTCCSCEQSVSLLPLGRNEGPVQTLVHVWNNSSVTAIDALCNEWPAFNTS